MKTLDITKLKRYSEIAEDNHTILLVPMTIISKPDYWQDILNKLEAYANSKDIIIKNREQTPQLMMQSFALGQPLKLEFIKNTQDIQDVDIIK